MDFLSRQRYDSYSGNILDNYDRDYADGEATLWKQMVQVAPAEDGSLYGTIDRANPHSGADVGWIAESFCREVKAYRKALQEKGEVTSVLGPEEQKINANGQLINWLR